MNASTEQDTLAQLSIDTDGLYQEEVFTDRRVGSIQRLTPVTSAGDPDPARPVLYIGQTQVMTPGGALPLNFELDAGSLEEAAQAFPEAAHAALEQTMEQLREMQREQASRIMTPDQIASGGMGGMGGGGAPGGGLQMR